MSQYRTRYERLGLPCPGDFVDSEETKNRLASLRLDSRANVLRVFSFAIAGCESLVGLKEILRAYRDPDVGPPQIAREVSNAKRLETIQRLGGKEAYLNLLKKRHIHRLFTDNVDPLCNSNDNFVVSTAKSVETRARGEFGNPRNSAESRITKSIIKEVYPEIHMDSADYSKKYREITGLRRSGRRLDVLVSHFGKGVLGLLPLAQDDSSLGLVGKVTDTMQVLSLPIPPTRLTFISGYHVFRMTSSKISYASWTNTKVFSFERSVTLPHRLWTEVSTGLLILLRNLSLKKLRRSRLWILRKARLVCRSFFREFQHLCNR